MDRVALLTDWIKSKHIGQMIPKTTAPYFDHLLAVAEMATPFVKMGYEIGLCHDLLEKTLTTPDELCAALFSFGYCQEEVSIIVKRVIELTDIYTKAAYPNISKAYRKEKEAHRLKNISPEAQTVKYADLIYNIRWVIKNDPAKAKKYFQNKRVLLTMMNSGDLQLRKQALLLLDENCL